MIKTDRDFECFPYNMRLHQLHCYFVVFGNGLVEKLGQNYENSENNAFLFNAVCRGQAKLYVSWRDDCQSILCQITGLNTFERENIRLLS